MHVTLLVFARCSWFKRSLLLSVIATLLGIPAFSASAKEVVEKFEDGKPHIRYQVDAKDHRNGTYEELTPEGKPKVRGNYLSDKKNGAWTTYADSGKPLEQATYRNNQLEGPYRYNFLSGHTQMAATYHQDDFAGPITAFDDKGHVLRSVSYPRRLDVVMRGWNTLYPKVREPVKFAEEPRAEAPYQAGRIPAETLQAALKYTMLYRFLSGLPFERMSIDPVFVDRAQHGAVVLAKIGSLTHMPAQPADMDKAFFTLAYAGCSQSNIYQGSSSLFDAVDAFMDDSDDSNIKIIGHRQWLLSPGLQRTGFGCCGNFVAQHVLSGGAGPGFTFCAYPGVGYYPLKLLHGGAAWSVHFARDKVKMGTADTLAVRITPLDEHFAGSDPITAEIATTIDGGMGDWRVIAFRPKLKSLEPGRYYVEIAGLRTPGGAPVPFSYLVDLRDIPEPGAKDQAAEKSDSGK